MRRPAKPVLEELEISDPRAVAAVSKHKSVIAIMAKWREEGRCPYCGELGRFINSAPVCSTHGPYLPPKGSVYFDGGDRREKDESKEKPKQ